MKDFPSLGATLCKRGSLPSFFTNSLQKGKTKWLAVTQSPGYLAKANHALVQTPPGLTDQDRQQLSCFGLAPKGMSH